MGRLRLRKTCFFALDRKWVVYDQKNEPFKKQPKYGRWNLCGMFMFRDVADIIIRGFS